MKKIISDINVKVTVDGYEVNLVKEEGFSLNILTGDIGRKEKKEFKTETGLRTYLEKLKEEQVNGLISFTHESIQQFHLINLKYGK